MSHHQRPHSKLSANIRKVEKKKKKRSEKEEMKAEIKSKNTNFKKEHSSNVETALNTTTINTINKENKNMWYFDTGTQQPK